MAGPKKKIAPPVSIIYQPLAGSNRRRSSSSKLIGPASAKEAVSITIIVRRRTDGPPMPDFNYGPRTPPSQRKSLSTEEFTQLYGASQADLQAVVKFATAARLTVLETNATRRTVVAKGTVAQMDAAFGIHLQSYDSPLPKARPEKWARTTAGKSRQIHRSYEGDLHVPQSLAGVIVGVFGLDNRRITGRNADPPNTGYLTVPQVCRLYGWPFGPIQGQTVGILSEVFVPTPAEAALGIAPSGGFNQSDLHLYYNYLNTNLKNLNNNQAYLEPTPVPVFQPGETNPAATNLSVADAETTQDICIASTVAQGAEIAVYFFDGTANGWLAALGAAIHPVTGQPKPSVISSSFYVSGGDDPTGLAEWKVTSSEIASLSSLFYDATMKKEGVTVCIATGDDGADSSVNDGYAHVQYPASDPSVLGCGGTTIGNITGSNFDECIWNDAWGATGGGVSGGYDGNGLFVGFPLPSWQAQAGVPRSLNDSHSGRGVPDVAANASGASGYYPIFVAGQYFTGNGTSASAPLNAGLIAQVNAKLGYSVGFLNPILYATHGMACRKIKAGLPLNGVLQNPYPRPADNACDGVTGYMGTQSGWDACTGWGVFDWNGLLNVLTKAKEKEKEKEKEQDKFFDKPWKAETELKPVAEVIPPGDPGDPFQGDPFEWLQTILSAQVVSQLGQIGNSIEILGQDLRALRSFIRPDDRPALGEQALAQSAAQSKKSGAGGAAESTKKN